MADDEDPEGGTAGLGDSEEGFEEETFTNTGSANNRVSEADDQVDIKSRNVSSMDTPSTEAAVR